MAYILLEPRGERKGILVLKHLEVDYFSKLPESCIDSVSEAYHIAVYFGYYTKLERDIPWSDFYIADHNVLDIEGSSLPILRLNGFSFIDTSDFSVDNSFVGVREGFVFIGSSQVRKNTTQLVDALSDPRFIDNPPKVVIINLVTPNVEGRLYTYFVRKKLKSLHQRVRGAVTYLEIGPHQDKLPKYVLGTIFSRSRCLICISSAEGAARVVAEAALGGLRVISYGGMKGGTNNYLIDGRDIVLDDLDDLPKAISVVMDETSYNCEVTPNWQSYDQESSRAKMIAFLVSHGFMNNDDLERVAVLKLYNAFSGHQNRLPCVLSSESSDEVLGYRKMLRFYTYLTGNKPDGHLEMISWIKDSILTGRRPYVAFKGVVKVILAVFFKR